MKQVTYKCDKCGKDISEHGVVIEFKFHSIHNSEVSDTTHNGLNLDVCVDCKKKIVNQLTEAG